MERYSRATALAFLEGYCPCFHRLFISNLHHVQQELERLGVKEDRLDTIIDYYALKMLVLALNKAYRKMMIDLDPNLESFHRQLNAFEKELRACQIDLGRDSEELDSIFFRVYRHYAIHEA